MKAGPSGLAGRDALLSRLICAAWPFSPLLDAFPVHRAARVLDLGGGDGGLLSELERRGHGGRRELIDLQHGTDAHALPFPAGSFDRVFMLRVLGHLHTPALALAEACRVPVPGGALVVAAHGPQHLDGLLPPGQAAGFPFALAGTEVQPFETTLPILLDLTDQQALAASYDLPHKPSVPIHSRLQLSGWVLNN